MCWRVLRASGARGDSWRVIEGFDGVTKYNNGKRLFLGSGEIWKLM